MPELDRQKTEEFIRLHAQHARCEKRMKELKAELLPQIVDGATSSTELPFLLVNQPQSKKQPDWKGYALALLLRLYARSKDPEAKAAAELERVDQSWEKKESPALHVVINKDFAGSLESRPKVILFTA